ncbi:uncharacterized protein LOC132698179 [Cylas formicarius]|uniref:uncharacterized protein LOC132698179 n=1 Tax=Cylas formicarius TaxID=197179 RepID=UPI0029583ACB|nr:uncharacterized protein LOC132698179 [Cylas formicarius]
MADDIKTVADAEFGDGNYKSCFARSVAVNAQHKHPKIEPRKSSDGNEEISDGLCFFSRDRPEPVRFRKNSRVVAEESRRFSCGSIGYPKYPPTCSPRLKELPIENMVNNSKIETLQWQLKEIEKSREMYRAVMKQVVTFLEKAHHSLEDLGKRLNRKNSVPRSRSEHHITPDDAISNPPSRKASVDGDASSFLWNSSKKQEDAQPEKLAQEAYRLLRTARSVLSTREPNLVQADEPCDVEFLAQLAKEFPQTPEHRPQRATSFYVSPKLILPDHEPKISTAFNRKLSLQLTDVRRTSGKSRVSLAADTYSDFVAGTTKVDFEGHQDKGKGSPPAGSVSSAEDESGFSSLNSYQEVGLPGAEEVSARSVLLRSMLHSGEQQPRDVWQKPVSNGQHKRWHSSPAEHLDKQSVKVLWV